MAKRPTERAPRSDHDLGIHTTRAVEVARLELSAETGRAHAHRYEPTPFGVLDDLLLELGLDFPRYTFVDLGSGKGRVLCLAAHFPFKEVLGVELSPELHQIAVTNLAALPASWRRAKKARSVVGDASTFELPAGPLVLYLFNPFAAPILGRVLANLERALHADPRPVHLLYYMPVHADVLARSPILELRSTAKHWAIYGTK